MAGHGRQHVVEPLGDRRGPSSLSRSASSSARSRDQALDVALAEQRRHLAHDDGRCAEGLDHEAERSSSPAAPDRRCGGFGVELDHFGDQQHLAGDAAIGEGPLQPLIDEALMRRVLVDDDERILGLGDDEGVVHLRARSAERIGRLPAASSVPHPARVAARRGKRRKRRLALARRSRMSARPAVSLAVGEAWRLGVTSHPAAPCASSAACDRDAVARWPRAAKRLAQRATIRSERTPLRVAEPELGLGGMHVHVDLVGRQRQEQSKHGMAAVAARDRRRPRARRRRAACRAPGGH